FTPPSEKGAILILPEGATSENLLNLRAVTEEAQANAESWYRYAYLERGRTAINNDSSFLITGPKAGYDANKRNQTISIRGFKIALRKSFLDLLFSRNRMKVEVTRGLPGTSTKSGAYTPRPIASGSELEALGNHSASFRGVLQELPGEPGHSSRTLVDAK
ncbi:hypothetical protein PAXINDRAFT_172487, partial [Paxillus involutus ATCC 200175]